MSRKTVRSRGGKSDFSASVSTLASSTSSTTSSTSTLTEGSGPKKGHIAALQNKLGLGGTAPTVSTTSKPKSSPSTPPQSNSKPQSTATSEGGIRKEDKDFGAAFGALSSTYGFGGSAAPSTSRSSK